jgi:hypothetical protein
MMSGTATVSPPQADGWAMFNVDPFLAQRVVRYHHKHGFRCAVETGTFKGHTTVGLAKLFPKVYTIELDEALYQQTTPRFDVYHNVTALHGNSPEVIQRILPELDYPLFVYLDAHWNTYWPLRDELTPLLSVKRPKLIMIHDVRVPGRSFGYDAYAGRPCDLDLIGDLLSHDECRYAFNDRTAPNSANRGVLFIEHLLD